MTFMTVLLRHISCNRPFKYSLRYGMLINVEDASDSGRTVAEPAEGKNDDLCIPDGAGEGRLRELLQCL
jgi:hypothetical protein